MLISVASIVACRMPSCHAILDRDHHRLRLVGDVKPFACLVEAGVPRGSLTTAVSTQ